MTEMILIIGGLILAAVLIRGLLMPRTKAPASTPVERDWGAFVDNLTRHPDPDILERKLTMLSDQELVSLHRWFGFSPPGDDVSNLDEGTRTQITLDIFRRILGL